ncbi:MAG: ABC transporter ATP-binding protein [bacterium]|nr:ABC transporter ATP-binding protein [bacterium]
MLELKNVSKFYSNKKMVSVGFSKVSLKFDIGEFIAITGESGSGKSTLLNVISGLDSYEEGEMLINGQETSHYSEKDYEMYRKKYIGNIFQNFNLVNSYTVYQNIELVLLLNGKKKSEVKDKVLDLIDKVNLKKYKNTKVSKLSGGQKQRVGIARALALDTPIILADEPTGNLDKKSSESVLELLYNISKEKLVIVVTHNYDQIEKYVTRKITMHDGRVLSDTIIKKHENVDKIKENISHDVGLANKIRLGVRNAFNIPTKFLLILAVYLFIVFSTFFVYSSFQELKYENSIDGYNNFFNNLDKKRVIIKKKDKTAFTDDDYENISKLSNIDRIVKNDMSLDQNISLSSNKFYYYGIVQSVNLITKVDKGRMPENDREVVLVTNEYDYSISEEYDEVIESNFTLEELYEEENKIKIVGVIFNNDTYNNIIYISDMLLEKLNDRINKRFSEVTYTFKGISGTSYYGSKNNEILPSDKVKSGYAIINDDWKYECANDNCNNEKLNIKVKNIFYELNNNYAFLSTYTNETIKKVSGYDKDYYGAIFINTNDYNSLYNRGYFQSSVFVEDEKLVRNTMNELDKLGFTTLYIKDTVYAYDSSVTAVLNIVMLVVILSLIIVLFYTSYFIIKLVLKSRNTYYSTLRVLGSSFNVSKSILNIELLTIAHLAYLIFAIFIIFIKKSIINSDSLISLCSYVSGLDYIMLYVILIFMTLLITFRYARKLFKDTIMNNYRQEV